MRRFMLGLAALLLSGGAARADEVQLPRIAVLDLTSRDLSEGELLLLTERLRVSLFSTGQFQVLEREKVQEILDEQGFQMSRCAATECAVEIGRLVGAEKMVAGSVGKIGSQYSLIIRLINVETGAIERTAVRDCRCPIEDVMTNTIGEAAGELGGAGAASGVLQSGPSTARPAPTPAPAVHGTDAQRGRADGERDAHAAVNKPLWFAAGCLGGCIGVGVAYLMSPNPPALVLLGKSPEYAAAYTDAYKARAKSDQRKWAWYGCGTYAVAYLLYIAVVTAQTP